MSVRMPLIWLVHPSQMYTMRVQLESMALLALYKDGPVFEAVAIDASGCPRPDWAETLARRPLRTRRLPAGMVREPAWEPAVRRLAAALEPARRPVALVAVVVGP